METGSAEATERDICQHCGREYSRDVDPLSEKERAEFPSHCPSDDCPGREDSEGEWTD